MYHVLVVAPQVPHLPNLTITEEINALGDLDNVRLNVLVGSSVTLERVADRLARQTYDAFLFAGHGLPGRLILSDSSSIEPRWLANQLASHGVEVAILSACMSGARPGERVLALGFADTLPAVGVNLIAMAIEISDRNALRYDVTLLEALASGATLRQAHEVGLEAIAADAEAPVPQLFGADTVQMDGDLRSLREKVTTLGEQLVTEQPEEAHETIRECIIALARIDASLAETYNLSIKTQREVRAMQQRIVVIERQLSPPLAVTFWRIMAGIAIMVAGSLFWVFQTREILFGLYPWLGAFVEALLLSLAASFFWMSRLVMRSHSNVT